MEQIYTYEEVLKSTTEYFNGDELASSVFCSKYALKNKDGKFLEKSPQDMHWRIANEFARIEKNKFKNPFSSQQFFDLLDRFKYIIPQGSPMFGIGNNFQIVSLSNCYVLETPLDSYSSILKTDEQLVNISKRRGGTGINLSNLRPEGTITNNAAQTSTGISTWMERYSNSIREVGQGGRRGALMLTLDIRHPDIEKFITIKQNNTKVTGANISVMLNHDFLSKVKADKEFELKWPIDSKNPKITKTIRAKELWDLLIKAARDTAEPGILMWDNVLEGPADCYKEYRSVATNPCGEIPLCSFDSCRLICLNLYSYVNKPFTKEAAFDYVLFDKHVQIAQRMMDDLVDLESEKIDQIISKIQSDPEPDIIKRDELDLWSKIKKFNNEGRRTGLGITAMGDCLAALGIGYGTPESVQKVGEIYRQLKLSSYSSSVDMAEELGHFKGFDPEKEKSNKFLLRIKEEDPALHKKMQKFGRRNIAILTTAPTGTVSIETQTSSGIEPVFQLEYIRRKKVNHNDEKAKVDFVDQSGDKWEEFTIYHPKVKDWMDATGLKDVKKSPWFGYLANDIDWINRVKLQAEAQKHVCHAISSTVNLPNDISQETVSKIYQTAFESGCKGLTVYRDGCRSGVLVNKKEETNQIPESNPPKRPKILKGELHHFKIDSKQYYVAVGLYGDNLRPYEIFTGENKDKKDLYIPKSSKIGEIRKNGRGDYTFIDEEKIEHELNNGHADCTADALTRLTSCSLRHGSDISFIVHQLEKTKGPIVSFSKALARSLKKYITNNCKVKGEECPTCKSEMVRLEGCKTCKNCGYSAC